MNPDACPHADKHRYENRAAANSAFRQLKTRRRSGAHVYHCRHCGGYHIGRYFRRPTADWRA